MAERTFYVVCKDDCLTEGMSKEQILATIEQSLEQGYVSDPSSAVFSKIKEIRANETAQIWIGTEAQFNAISPAPTISKSVVRMGTNGVLYLCTDDSTVQDVTPIGGGGTGGTTAEQARTNLDVYSKAETINAINNVDAGGVNLYTGSRNFTGDWNNISSWTKHSSNYNGLPVYTRSTAWNGLSQTVAVNAGETYTLSAYMKAASGADVRFICKDSSSVYLSDANNKKLSVGTDWARYSVTFTISTSGKMQARFENAKAVNMYICGLKLERGTIATDWSLSPDDFCAPSLVDIIYPVGSIYMSVNSTSPATLFGGTWEQIKDTFLLSAGDIYAAGATGGEAEHELTAAELPDHIHHPYKFSTGEDDWAFMMVKRDGNHTRTQVATSSSSGKYTITNTTNTNLDWPYYTLEDEAELEGAAHNNMPPYLAVYVWKRIG